MSYPYDPPAYLPNDWHPHNGLSYPLTLKIDGITMTFYNYTDHHKVISAQCMKFREKYGQVTL